MSLLKKMKYMYVLIRFATNNGTFQCYLGSMMVYDMLVGCLGLHCNFSGLPLFFHRFCPQAIAEVLKVNKTLTDIDLSMNDFGKEGTEAWYLAKGLWVQAMEW